MRKKSGKNKSGSKSSRVTSIRRRKEKLNAISREAWKWLRSYKPYISDYNKYYSNLKSPPSRDRRRLLIKKWGFEPSLNPKERLTRYAPAAIQKHIREKYMSKYATEGCIVTSTYSGKLHLSEDGELLTLLDANLFRVQIDVDISRPIDYLVKTIEARLKFLRDSYNIPTRKPKAGDFVLQKYQVDVMLNQGLDTKIIANEVMKTTDLSSESARRRLNRIRKDLSNSHDPNNRDT